MKRSKNSWNLTRSACQTIKVVISPNGLHAPPAFAATTIFTQPTATTCGLSFATATNTAAINRAVVRLSAIGEIKNANTPVIQKIQYSDKPFETNQARNAPNKLRSSKVFTKVIAANKNSISLPYSRKL